MSDRNLTIRTVSRRTDKVLSHTRRGDVTYLIYYNSYNSDISSRHDCSWIKVTGPDCDTREDFNALIPEKLANELRFIWKSTDNDKFIVYSDSSSRTQLSDRDWADAMNNCDYEFDNIRAMVDTVVLR